LHPRETPFRLTFEPGISLYQKVMIARLILLTAGLLPVCLAQTFDVASIHTSQYQSGDGEGNRRESIETTPDGVTLRNVTLQSCIAWAYSVQDFQIAGTLGADRFDIVAKSAASATVPMLRTMLGTLLAERFKLTFHRGTKELTSLALVVAKGGPKLRASTENSPGVLKPDRSAMVAQHATIAEFAGTLAGPLRTPVIDQTGLTGRYDFTVDLSSYFSDFKAGQQPDLTGILMTALREQLGLNLESKKEPVEILVIDHAEKIPSGN
jgi:uncharacterized protein (TIGR03435 family)